MGWSVVSVLVVLSGAITSAAAAGAIVIPACANGPCVIVQVVGADGGVQSSQEVDADTIVGPDADVKDESYPIKGGTAASVKPGTSVNRLVGLVLGPAAGTVTYAEVVWDDAFQRHLLTGRELGAGTQAGFQDGLLPAFYSTDPGTPQRLNYIRPQRSADDDNGAPGPDQGTRFTDPQGAFLVRLHTAGQVLTPQVTASATDSTNRTYVLSTDQSGAGSTYDWVLPDGSRSSAAQPTFTFPTGSLAGTYPVSVGVGTSDGSFGWGSADVRAGEPPASTPTAGPSGPGGTGEASKGPRKNPTATRSADPNPVPTGGTGTPQPQPTATASGSPGPVSTEAPGSLAPRPSEIATTAPPATEAPQATGDEVTGILLAAAEPLDPADAPAGQDVADPPPPSPSASALGSGPVRVAAAVWVGGGVLLLLLVGAASESGLTRGRLRRRSRIDR